MFCSKISKIIKTSKNDIDSFLAILFCTVVILSTLGYSVGIRNSFAQQLRKEQLQQPSTLSESPWSNNLPTFYTGNTQHHNIVISSSQTFTNSKNLDLNHAFVSNKIIGPDRFRFITSYWTTSQTNRGVDVGTSANDTFVSANSLPPNQKIEVYPNEGLKLLLLYYSMKV
ncbi:MAG: hypothetical protein WBZ36_04120, partial [Candidatus Nitrosopolaris sp.]